MHKPHSAETNCRGFGFTHIEEVSRHAAAVALLVPVRSLAARIVEVSRQAAVVAVPVGTLAHQVAWGAAKEAG